MCHKYDILIGALPPAFLPTLIVLIADFGAIKVMHFDLMKTTWRP